jgi:hypothetical protein
MVLLLLIETNYQHRISSGAVTSHLTTNDPTSPSRNTFKTTSYSISGSTVDITREGRQTRQPIHDWDKLRTSMSQSERTEKARLCIINTKNLSSFDIDALNSILRCGDEVFHNHIQRASDDIALILPSIGLKKSHFVVPYRRMYERSLRKDIRERRNLRNSFAHGAPVTTEEHVTVWISPVVDKTWTGNFTDSLPCYQKC